jgi:hypothetical protein
MAKRIPKTRGPAVSTKIPILTLSGGVSRQPQSKRLPSEAQNIDNALVSLERSFEKRAGFELLPQSTFTGDISNWNSIPTSQRLDLFPLTDSGTTDYWFYWFNINESNRYLIVIDYKATTSNSVILRVFKINTDGTWTDQTEYTNSPTNTQQGTSIISNNTRAYLTYGSTDGNKAKDVLKATTSGQNIIVVNTLVKAGFTSGSDGYLFNLDGTVSGTTDTKGGLIAYYSAARYTKGANGKWYINTSAGTSVTITSGTITQGNTITVSAAPTLPSKLEFANPVSNTTTYDSYPSSQNRFYLIQDANNYAILDNWTNSGLSYKVSFVKGTPSTTLLLYSGYPPEVEDFIWHDIAEPWYGQSMVDFSEIRFPPEYAETPGGSGNNGLLFGATNLDSSAKTALQNLYDVESGAESGNGKIYYCSASYLNFSSGYYRVINSTTRPYTAKVRSPDLFSILDSRRMPMKIEFNATATYKWVAKEISWTPRTSGNRYSNPGPSIFLSSDKLTPRQVQIKAVSTFRDRIYFAAEDVIFTSQLGVYEDLFLSDPSNIIATDPIDIRASSNTFTEISSLTPFSSYLFVNTLGGVQYELKGSQNQITPLTAEISPTSFYSTAKFVEPQLLGSLIYFFDKSKLYLYLSSESSNISIAQELTINCQDYLPTTYRSICVAPSQNFLISVDDNNPNYLYIHSSRFAGDRNLQNAFFRYVLNSNEASMSIQSYDDYLYNVIKLPTTTKITNAVSPTLVEGTPDTNTTSQNRYYICRSYLRELNTSIPRLDRYFKIRLYDNNSDYDFSTNQTKIRVPLSFPYQDVSKYQFITDSSWSNDPDGDRVYEIVTPLSYIIKDTYIEFILNGRFVPVTTTPGTGVYTINYSDSTQNPKYIYLGIKFKMEVELSELFIRDQENNAIDGVLSLRTMVLRHKNTGNYDIEVSNRGRDSLVYSYTNQKQDENRDPLNLENYITEGEFICPILGFSDNVTLKIVSEYPTPVNIVNMEIKGKFIQKYSSLAR